MNNSTMANAFFVRTRRLDLPADKVDDVLTEFSYKRLPGLILKILVPHRNGTQRLLSPNGQ